MKTVLIDLWGTLLQLPETSTIGVIIKELDLPVNHHELIQICDEQGLFSKTIHSLTIWESILKKLNTDSQKATQANELWINSSKHVSFFPQTKEFLSTLKSRGYTLVLASAVDKDSFDNIRTQFDFEKYFDYSETTFEVGLSKSKEYYEKICLAIQANPQTTTMIGDTIDHDILPAQVAGLQTIYLSRYLLSEYQKDLLPKDTGICSTYQEVLSLLK